MNALGVIGLANTTYTILTNMGKLSDKITNLIQLHQLSHADKLNFKSLVRRLDMLEEPLRALEILRLKERVNQDQ